MNILRRFPRNIHGRDFVVGDIHGCFSILRDELERVEFDGYKDRLFSVGDLVDRGPESIEVLDWLKQIWFYPVMGNHEAFCIGYWKGTIRPSLYERNGGQWFMELDTETQSKIVEAFEKLPIIIDFIARDGTTVGIVHAECPRTQYSWQDIEREVCAGNERMIDQCISGREHFYAKTKVSVKGIDRVYHGHVALLKKLILGNRHYIDSGCYQTGKLIVEEI